MQPFPSLPEDRDEQVEWFHDLASLVEAGRVNLGELVLRTEISEFVTQHLPSHTLPVGMTDAECMNAVRILRENESSWNRALMRAISEACDLAASGEPQRAAEDLRAFASICPWVLFAEVAMNQASHFPA